METPVYLFSILKDYLDIQKGALLLQDPNSGFFVPWAQTGYDATSRHRLHIDETVIDRFLEKDKRIQILEARDLDELKPFFSSREADLLQKSIFYAFVFNEDTFAVLIISETKYLQFDSSIIKIIFSIIGEVSSVKLHESYDLRMQILTASPIITNEEMIEAAEKSIGKYDDAQFQPVFLTLPLDNIVKTIMKRNSVIDEFRLREDLRRLIANLCANIGPVSLKEDEKVLFFLSDYRINDPQIIFHQINSTLQALFQELDQNSSIQGSVVYYPQDGKNARELFDSIGNV